MGRQTVTSVAFCAALFASPMPTWADFADVIDVAIMKQADTGTYRVEVTVRHADEDWEHYADAWEILTEDGRVLGYRKLYHPHIDEQPFTRSLAGVEIPANIGRVIIRAHDRDHGWGGQEMAVDIPE